MMGLALLAILATGCFNRATGGGQIPVVKAGVDVNRLSQAAVAGDVLFTDPIPQYLFERATPPTAIQESSQDLVKIVLPHKELHVFALNSTKDTAALIVIEVSIHTRWGVLMIPAERKIIRAFADDPTLGKWLILLTDVDVRDEPDPIPLTAYRWTRAMVEQYKQCGIPAVQIDDCTRAFYQAAKTVLVSASVHVPQQ
jgi:hypothetical protein